MIKKLNIKRNWIFIVIMLGLIFAYVTRFTYLEDNVVPYPDCEVILSTEKNELEQTWQPEVKWISGVGFSYFAEDTFVCDLQLKVFSDDYSKILVENVLENYQFNEGESGIVNFAFDRTKIIHGERYRFQISILNSEENGSIRIAAGSNYGGCTVEGRDTGCGAALNITFAKFSKIFWLVSVMFPIISYAFLYMCLTNKKFEETVALSIFTEGLILYGFGLLECLTLGINVIYLLAIISLFVSIYLYNKKEMTLKELVSPGLILYFIFLIIIVLVNHGEWLAKRDDMRHWGIAVRDMYYYNSFAKHADTTVIMLKYLPFTALIEYVFVYMNGLFSEDILLIAYQIMMLSVIIIFSKPLRKENIAKKIVPVLVTIIAIPIIFYNDISSMIMVDPLQMMIVAYSLLCYYKEELNWFNKGRILCALLSLTLIKDIGLVLAAIVAFIMFLDGVIEQLREKKWKIRTIVFPMICVVAVLTAYIGWQVYWAVSIRTTVTQGTAQTVVAENGKIAQDVVVTNSGSSSGISINGIIKILSGNGEEYQYQVTTNYLTELFEGETYQFGNIKVSFVDLLLIIAFIVITLGYFGYWEKDRFRRYSFAGIAVLASSILCTFLQLTYWFTFGMYEALDLTSMERYLGTYLCALIMVVFYFIYEREHEGERKKEKEYLVYVLTFFLIICMPINRVLVKNNEIEWYATEEVIYGHDTLTDILRSVAKRGEEVQFICQGSSGYSEYVFRNSVCPIISSHAWWSISESGVSVEKFENILKDKEYLVLFYIDEQFIQTYGEVLNSDSALENGSVYKIHSDENSITLELLGRTGIKEWS